MTEGIDAVRRIVEHWPELTVEEWRELCTADVLYQNMPWDRTVIEGPDAIHSTLRDFAGRFDVTFDVRAVSGDGEVAFAERTEHFVPKAQGEGDPFDLPVAGVFELRDGRISAWRDYFDRRAMRS